MAAPEPMVTLRGQESAITSCLAGPLLGLLGTTFRLLGFDTQPMALPGFDSESTNLSFDPGAQSCGYQEQFSSSMKASCPDSCGCYCWLGFPVGCFWDPWSRS